MFFIIDDLEKVSVNVEIEIRVLHRIDDLEMLEPKTHLR